MRLARVQFKLLHLMIAVALIAGGLVLLETPRGFMVFCGLWSLVLATIFWAHLRHQRARAFRAFGIASLAVNCSFAWLSIYALNLWGMAGMFLGMLCGMPMILGELGYVTISRGGVELLFRVFADRYERGRILVTSNLPFSEWGQIFQGERMTAALLDRLTHHSHIFEMNGESYRFRESMKTTKGR